MGNWKSHENDNAYPDPLAQLLLKLLLTANVDVRRSFMRVAYTKAYIFQLFGKITCKAFYLECFYAYVCVHACRFHLFLTVCGL